ncbi:family 20 glycosylhydrolase [Niabella sp. CJ426]|uniref:glycoside hydrolase family 20 protein n=1 Tax=Niabella sp. CJ426 TaxID=3393740 RepID=UPI003CFBD58B
MKKSLLIFFLLITTYLFGQQALNLIPKPVSLEKGTGTFIIDQSTVLLYNSADQELQSAAVFLKAHIKRVSGIDLKAGANGSRKIELVIAPLETIGREGYLLDIKPVSITMKANTKAGIIYGIQTLLQTLPAIRTNAPLQVPCMKITDYPRFQWRGMHLDVSRHFFGPELVKEYIDLLASYKMNRFHWHLVDDQGWRIEIKKYPDFTKTGAWRVDQNNLVWGVRPQAKPGEAATYGGYYTQEQVKDIISYAAERNVMVVPEIEMPGHVASAIASYSWLSCAQQPQLSLTGGNYNGISSNYCAGNDSVFHFLEDVLREVTNLFPSPYIHIGGDEVDKTPWKNCARCQARIKKEGLKNEEELQSYFIKRIGKFINSQHKKMIGWDEILEGGLAEDATVMSWRGEAGGIKAAKMKHDVIMTPDYPLYFDHYQAGPEGEPLAFGGMNSLKNVYNYEPVSKELTEAESKFVLGAQANLWTEFITKPEGIEYMVLPRMPALAEAVWTPKEGRSLSSFMSRIPHHYKRYEQLGLRYSAGNFAVAINPVIKDGKLFVELSNEIPGSTIVYTSDGNEPVVGSAAYTQPLLIEASMVLKASTVTDQQVRNVQASKQSFVIHKGVGKSITYVHQPSKFYPANGPNSLLDGIKGTAAPGKYWHGFSGDDLIATVDLGATVSLHRISLGCLQSYRSWIFLPQWVRFEVSVDGEHFTEIKTVNTPFDIHDNYLQYDFKVSLGNTSARFIRVTAKNNNCPPDHPGAGAPGWIFADELMID